jgi:hypothetical protein
MDVGVERWRKAMVQADLPREELITLVRVELCLPPERDPDIARALDDHPPPHDRDVVTMWWDAV